MVAKATVDLPEGLTTLTDRGYRPMPSATLPPNNNAAHLAAHKQLRAQIEHVLAPMKDRQILRQCRRRRNAINPAMRCVAFPWNPRPTHL